MIQNILYTILETIFSKAYKMCLARDLYNIVASDGKNSQLRNDLFAVSCAKENITQSMLMEFARNPLSVRDCYPRSKRNMEKFIYLITSMLLIEDNCSEKAISEYKHSMYKLGLNDANMVKVMIALGQSNPKFQSAAISYIANIDADTLKHANGKSIHKKLYETYSELIHGVIPPSAEIEYIKDDRISCTISFKMRFTDYKLMIFNIHQQAIDVRLFSSSNLNGEWTFNKWQSQASMANQINDYIDKMICKNL